MFILYFNILIFGHTDSVKSEVQQIILFIDFFKNFYAW